MPDPAASPRWSARVSRAVVHAPRRAALLGVLVMGIMALGGLHLSVNFSFRAFTGSKAQAALEAQEATLTQRRGRAEGSLLFVTVRATDDTTLVTPQRLGAVAELEAALKKRPEVASVQSVLDAPAQKRGLLDQGDSLRDVLRGTPDADAAAAWPAAIRAAPFMIPLFIDAPATVTVLNVMLHPAPNDGGSGANGTVDALMASIDAATATWPDTLEVRVGGIPAVRHALIGRMLREQVLFTLLALLICALTLAYFFRSARELVIALACAGLPVGATFGVMGALGVPVDALTQIVSTLLPVIAVADAIHLLSAVRDAEQRLGPGLAAVIEGCTHVLPACLLTTVTTAAGFLSLCLTPIVALQVFGAIAALGLALCFFALVIFVPAGCALWPPRQSAAPHAPLRAPGPPGRLALGMGLVALVLCSGISMIHLDVSRDGLLGTQTKAAQAGALLDERLAGTLRLSVLVDADLKDPAVVARLLAFEADAAKHPAVKQVIGAATLWSTMGQELTQAAPPGPGITGDAALLAQVQLLSQNDERATQLFWPGQTRVIVAAQDRGAQATLALRDDLESSLAQHRLSGNVASLQLATYEGVVSITRELLKGLLALLLFLAVLFAAVFRSVRLSLIALLCNVIPLGAALGALGWVAPNLNPVSAVVLTVALGLSVDDTIHVIHAHVSGAPDRLPDATRRALWTTTVMLVLAFCVVALSDFPVNRTFGLIGASAAAVAYGIDISLLLVLLRHQSRG